MKTRVIVQRVGSEATDREAVIEAALTVLNQVKAASELIPAGARVVIKPNVTDERDIWRQGIVTNPYVVEGVIRYVQKAHPAEIIVAEGIAVGLDTSKGFAANGYFELARRTGVELRDLNQDDCVSVPVLNGLVAKEIKVSKTVAEADFLINVPVIKTHVATGVTLGLKNLKGTVPAAEKKRSHFLGVNKFVVDINSVVHTDLCLLDGTVGLEGDGPTAGTPVNLGLLLAGTDVVATDRVAAQLMGFDPMELKLFQNAQVQKLGVWPAEDVEIIGEDPSKVQRIFKRAEASLPEMSLVTVIDGGACSGCRQGVRVALERLRQAGQLERLPPVRILMGEQADEQAIPKQADLVVGRCLRQYKNFDYYVPGCPPQVFLIADELRELCGGQRIFGSKQEFMFEEGE